LIKIYSIEKVKKDHFYELNQNYKKLISSFSKIQEQSIMNKSIVKAHNIGEKEAKDIYANTFEPLKGIFNIALDVKGERLNTKEFSKLFEKKIVFFIGGAYGFSDSFISSCDKSISLSPLTFSHKLAKTILYEQIYRALCIKNNHPYHKGDM